MKIKKRERDGVTILDLEGNININSSDLIETVGWVVNRNAKKILCNFEGVNLIDYIGVSVLAIIYKNALNNEGSIKLYQVPVHVKKLFSIVGLDRVFDCLDTEDMGIESFLEDEAIGAILRKKLRRKFTRVPFKCPVAFKEKQAKQPGSFRGKIINLSGTGAFIIGKKTFPIGTSLMSRIYLMPEPGVVEVEAKVVWVSDSNKMFLEYPAMGIEFYEVTSKKQKIILDFVEKHMAKEDI